MPARVHLFCEDAAHEAWARALVARIAAEESVAVSLRPVSSRLGIPRLERELRALDAALRHTAGLPDLLLILVDANAVGPAARHRQIAGAIDLTAFPHAVVGTPDPCVERWFLADPQSFREAFGPTESIPATADCEIWKRELETALERAGEILTEGGTEFAQEVIEVMDLYRAGKSNPTIKAVVDELRGALRQLASRNAGSG